jgi:transposase
MSRTLSKRLLNRLDRSSAQSLEVFGEAGELRSEIQETRGAALCRSLREVRDTFCADRLAERGMTAVIPSRLRQSHLQQRSVTERTFCRLKDWRRIATRFNCNIKFFGAFISLTAAIIWRL